ncbi:metallophosphoesterase family protein [Ornithinicoccus halotolerans]|uniref:metallophosphoesterase family protein n=1 Tax=Ornithinicoccus halotolerans TaxID=1748220 RepID=UPI0012965F19|nr:metallophosphoesterase family protein [Ornithinicoccus halotolerans]
MSDVDQAPDGANRAARPGALSAWSARWWTPGRRPLRGVLAAALLAVLGYGGGVATTSLWPIHVETDHFSAAVRVSPSFFKASTVHNPTVFGDIDLRFGGPVPAPGIESQVQVKEEITDVFTRGRVDIGALYPDQGQLREALSDGLQELMWKFGGGALATVSLVVVLWHLGRPRWAWHPAAATIVSAAVLAAAVPGTAALLTYRQGNLVTFTTTSLLGTVRSNAGMFTDIRGQAQQATPYVQNLLALSDALQAEFLPEEATGPTAARFLLVSDIHGMNYYALMEQVIQDEGITAVIDTGDLLNFGRTAEGEMSGIFADIEDLGVPYIFVRGNHDAVSPHDEALLRRMSEIPNVILLEPTAGEYVEASVNGVRLSGYNDWRHFGEANEDFAAQQEAAASRYRTAIGDRPVPDVVMTHQPYALDELESGQVKLNGHMHSTLLADNRVQIGTFTGGGLVNHFQAPGTDEEDEELAGELVGQPYAFDILAFGEDCSVQSVTRYTYRNLVSGRPQFDNVSVINGSTIAQEPAPPLDPEQEEPRSCGPDAGVSTEQVGQVDPEDWEDEDAG